jgi:hypothetical protein
VDEILDFGRLHQQATFEAIVATNPHAPPRRRQDGIASKRAAWSPRDLRDAFDQVGLGDLKGGRKPRIGALQAYFAPRRDGRPSAHDARRSAPALPRASQVMYRRQCVGIPTSAAHDRSLRGRDRAVAP